MNNKSLNIKGCSLSSASEEVVTSVMTSLIETAVDKVAMDKVAVEKTAVEKVAEKSSNEKKVVRKANIVQRKSLELKFRGKDEIVSRERVENVKKTSGSKSFTPMWVEEPKLPSGWKSCVAGDVDCALGLMQCHMDVKKCIFYAAPGKAALYYSPCGSLFTNWAQVTPTIHASIVERP